MQSLTDKQKQILIAIQRHIALTGHSPTVREIGSAVDLKSSCSVQKHLDTLERLGKIQRTSFKYRSIELIEDGLPDFPSAWAAAAFVVPLLGQVTGGHPARLSANTKPNQSKQEPELLFVPHSQVCNSERAAQADACALRNYDAAPYFALAVKGDSMHGAGISDGDVVVARRQRAADDGQIVIAQVGGGEATVKRLFNEGRAMRLQPENPNYMPIISREVRVIARVTLAIKSF